MRHPQNMTGLRLGLVVLSTNKLRAVSEHAGMIAAAIERVGHGMCEIVTLPRPPKRGRPLDPSL
jgi:hypothetical protein